MIVAMANRSGGKTMDMAILGVLDTLANDYCESANIAAIRFQADKCMSYMKGFIRHSPDLANRLAGEPTASKVPWSNGSLNEVLIASKSGVNSPHPQKLKADEVDLWDWTILQEAFSMVQSKEGVEGVTILGSTRKIANGPMQRLIDRIELSMRKGSKTERLYSWCAFEVMEALPTHDKEKMEEIQKVFGEYMPERVHLCNGYYKWDDLLEKAGNLDREVLEAQWFCCKPETSGLIYSRFDERANVVEDFKVDHQALINGWAQVYIFEDFGSTKDHPDVILFAWIPTGKQEVTIFDELYSWDKSEDEVLSDFDEKLRTHGLTRQDISGWIGDPHAATEQLNRANKGLPMMGNKFLADDQDKLPGEMYNITNGIPHVRKFIEDRRLKLTSNIVELRVELQTYAWKKGPDGRYINVPIKDFDHGCFVSGTLVKTERGDVPIEQIVVGDVCITPYGKSKVLASECTGKKPVFEFMGMKGTADHPFITQRGVVRMDALRYDDIVCVAKLSRWMESNSVGILNQIVGLCGLTISLLKRLKAKERNYTFIFGKKQTDQYQKGFMYIIKMAILLITHWRIWSVYPLHNIRKDTGSSGERKGYPQSWIILKKLESWLLSGMAHLMGLSFIKELASKVGKTKRKDWLMRYAYNVDNRIKRISQQGQSSVTKTVKLVPCGDAEVYNIETEHGIYVANDVVISNCDALRYGLIWLFPNQAWSSFSTDAYGGKEEDDYAKPYTAGLYEKTF